MHAGMHRCRGGCIIPVRSRRQEHCSKQHRSERTCHMRGEGLTTVCVLALVSAISSVTPVAVEGQAPTSRNKAQTSTTKNQVSTGKKTTAAGRTATTWTQPRTLWGDP